MNSYSNFIKVKKYYYISICIIITYFSFLLAFGIIYFNNNNSQLKEQIGNSAMLLAISTAENYKLSSNEFERLLDLEFNELLQDETNINFEKQARQVMEYSDIRYIYLESEITEKQAKYQVEIEETNKYGQPAGTLLKVVYVLDAVKSDLVRMEDTEGKGYQDKDRYTVITPKFKENSQDRMPNYFINIDEWGTYITGYAPFYDTEKVFRGLIGVDVCIDSYLAGIEKNRLTLLVLAVTLLLMAFTLTFLHNKLIKSERYALQISQLSNTDSLTELLNRRGFKEKTNKKWQNNIDQQQPVAMLLVDVDLFKLYNDYYGHLAGDQVLYRIARVLEECAKSYDGIVGRYGGDEFIVFVEGVDEAGAIQIADNIITKVKKLNININYSTIANIQTVSIGIASLIPTLDLTAEDIFKCADLALYKAKNCGRNCVFVWKD